MNLRWLWMDHVPPGIELTAAQRLQVRKLAYKHRFTPGRMQQTDEAFGKAMRPWIMLLFPLWLLHIVLIGKWTSIIPLALAFTLLPMVTLYNYHRTYRVHVYRALCDLGLEVCTRCGYALHTCSDDTTTCPECGEGRSNPDDSDKSTN